jgi:hypothetical protein
MLSLPFDVLFLVCPYQPESCVLLLPNELLLSQIFSELGPMDLVNLARTNKALRDVLMSRKSIWVWLISRRNAGVTKVPNPPDDMSEPAWALLLFGPAVCSVCSQESLRIVFDFGLILLTAMFYKKHPSGRLCPSPSFVHSLQEKIVRKESFTMPWMILIVKSHQPRPCGQISVSMPWLE